MKTNTKSLFCIFITMLFLSTGEVKAIEQTRYNMNDITRPGSIIRHYDEGIDIVCYNNYNYPYFMIYKYGIATTNELFLHPMDTVCDFEIYNDTVYFCGEGHIRIAGDAIVGYFAVADLLNPNPSNVFYLTLPTMKTIKAIEVDWFASRKHVVGVGASIDSEGMMVDMIDNSTFWTIHHADVGGDTILLSDLAITLNNVVVTSTKNVVGQPNYGRLWYFLKPTTAGSSIFPCGVTFWDQIIHLGRKYLIKAMGGNNFVTAASRGPVWGFSTSFIVSYYYNLAYTESVVIDEENGSFVALGDMNYAMGTWVVNLLAHGLFYTDAGYVPRSVIYELNHTSLPATVSAHVYDGVFFESLDRAKSFNLDEQHFVSSGYETNGSETPYYLKYHSLYFGGKCLDKMEKDVKQLEIGHYDNQTNITRTYTQQVPVVIMSDRKEMRIETPCTATTYPPVPEDENQQ